MGKEIHYKLDVKDAMKEERFVLIEVEIGEGVNVEMELGVKYLAFKDPLNWYQAEASCVSKGGHLVSVKSQEEVEEIKAAAKAGLEWLDFFLYRSLR